MEWRYHGEAKAREVESYLHRLPIAVIAVDVERATRAAALKQKHNLVMPTLSPPNSPWSAAPGWSPPTQSSQSWEKCYRSTRFPATKSRNGDGLASARR